MASQKIRRKRWTKEDVSSLEEVVNEITEKNEWKHKANVYHKENIPVWKAICTRLFPSREWKHVRRKYKDKLDPAFVSASKRPLTLLERRLAFPTARNQTQRSEGVSNTEIASRIDICKIKY